MRMSIHVDDYNSFIWMSPQKMSFIIIWNVTGLLVRSKNMTRDLNRPLFAKAAFHHLCPLFSHCCNPIRCLVW